MEKQVEIGSSILENWPGTGQTDVEGLKQRYAMDDFDPETKFYAFKDDEMVGFLTATIKANKEGEDILRANMEFPIVLEGNEEAENILMEQAISVLKAKGVGRVQSRGSVLWGKTNEYVKAYEYTQKHQLTPLVAHHICKRDFPFGWIDVIINGRNNMPLILLVVVVAVHVQSLVLNRILTK